MDVWGGVGEDIAATTDIRLPLERLKFSVRVALLCVRDGELLVQTSGGAGAPEPFFFLPGGALRTDEDAARCARREWEEEQVGGADRTGRASGVPAARA